jgi:hypothetical protein
MRFADLARGVARRDCAALLRHPIVTAQYVMPQPTPPATGRTAHHAASDAPRPRR